MQLSRSSDAIERLLLLAALGATANREPRLAAADALLAQLIGRGVRAAPAEVARLERDCDPQAALLLLADFLTYDGRVLVLRAVVLVATATGPADIADRAFIARCGRALGIVPDTTANHGGVQ